MKGLEPEPLYRHFATISAIPRPSKHESGMIKYLKEFAESRGLEHCSDRAGNLVIRRPSSFNPENPVIVQGHIDMVRYMLPVVYEVASFLAPS